MTTTETGYAKLTDEQIRETVDRMSLSPKLKATLLRNALKLKQPEARFVIFAAWKQSNIGGLK